MALKASVSRKLTGALLLDQSATYDLLDHSILLKKLAVYNFDDNTISWFKSYLSGRSQAVQVETKQGVLEDLDDHAAPQGSVLGGLLFIINENDFPACRVEGESGVFVDDDTDTVSDVNPDILLDKMQKEADNSCDWLRDTRMCVAGQKSKLLIIGTKELKKKKCEDREFSINVDGKLVKETQSEKLLGVIMNNKLTWNEHLYGESWRTEGEKSKGLIPQLSQRLGLLKKLSWVASKRKLKILAQGLFYSKLSYCLPLFLNTWGLDNYRDGETRATSCTKEDIRKMQVLQNQVARLQVNRRELQGKVNMSTVELLNLSGDLSVHQLGALSTIKMTKKIMMTQKPTYLAQRLQTPLDRGTRSGETLAQEKTRLGLAREGFVYRGTKLYNLLPHSMKQESIMISFKRQAKIWVKENIPVKP